MGDGVRRGRHPASGRHWARRYAMQGLYQWQLTGQSLSEIDGQFVEEEDMARADSEYFRELLHEIPTRLAEVEAALTPHLERAMDQVDPVERAILWIGAYELWRRKDVPYRVVINEAVELAKKYGAEHGHRFVNGVLDKVARTLRSDEFSGRR